MIIFTRSDYQTLSEGEMQNLQRDRIANTLLAASREGLYIAPPVQHS
jgi:hypothetical protein